MARRLALTAFTITVVSLGLFLFHIGQPAGYIYDEPNYVISARTFLAGTPDTNPEHPPLAKILIAGGVKVAGDNPFGWRLAGAVCGALTLSALFLWTYALIGDYSLALTAAVLTLLNNFLFVMSRVAMLDVFFFAFVMWGVLAFTAALRTDSAGSMRLGRFTLLQRRLLILACGVLFGLGGACKWTAVVTLAAVVLVAAILFLSKSFGIRELGVPTLFSGLLLLPLLTYGLAYWPLCHELHRPFTVHEIAGMNAYIWRYHVLCPGNPALHVPWQRWLFRTAPERGLRYLMGNFVVLWTGVFALVICAARIFRGWKDALPEGLVLMFYAVNLLQWVIIPQKLTCYYYYYPPAMFLGVAIAIVFRRANQPAVFGVRLSLLLTVAAAVFFVYCLPRMLDLQAPFDCAFGCWS